VENVGGSAGCQQVLVVWEVWTVTEEDLVVKKRTVILEECPVCFQVEGNPALEEVRRRIAERRGAGGREEEMEEMEEMVAVNESGRRFNRDAEGRCPVVGY
jgi:hypothetical protein